MTPGSDTSMGKFELPFDEIRRMVGLRRRRASSPAGRGDGSRGPRSGLPTPDLVCQCAVVDAFFRAARGGDIDGLVAVLDPDVVLREERVRRIVLAVLDWPETSCWHALAHTAAVFGSEVPGFSWRSLRFGRQCAPSSRATVASSIFTGNFV